MPYKHRIIVSEIQLIQRVSYLVEAFCGNVGIDPGSFAAIVVPHQTLYVANNLTFAFVVTAVVIVVISFAFAEMEGQYQSRHLPSLKCQMNIHQDN